MFSKDPPTERVHSLTITNVKLLIPPGRCRLSGTGELLAAAGHEAGEPESAHAPARKIARISRHLSHRRIQTLLRVPNYSFSWQLSYYLAKQKILPGGKRIECTGRYDNSPNNPNNPDPTKEVRWGDQSWEEMLIGTLDLAIPPQMDLMDLYRPKKTGSD